MQFYVGWSHSDAIFTDYYPDCSILVSAVPDNKGTIGRFKTKPKKLILDCGSVYYVKQETRPSLKDIFQIQISFLESCDPYEAYMVHFDEPMLNKTSLSERYMAMEKTLFNAYEYMNLFNSKNFPRHVVPMGVIQGYDRASIEFSAKELSRIGYRSFGIGSLLSQNQNKQIEMINYAADIVGSSNLHVFGVTGVPQMQAMINIGVKSFDSTRPTMAAAFFQVFYSRPFKTFFLSKSHAKLSSPRLSEPLPCNCPVCQINAYDLFIPSPRKHMRLRSIHNYYHLSIVINDLLKEKNGGEAYALPDVLWTRN
ncbi:queuine tRNA-ribosyltransferase [Paenibacillus polymyxa]|uniref:Queuine tRNA-ribosyltransferase n=1 Tax=Paenibacillus polymyxa (strain SC2) TaxID=886882 RepID=E3EGG8_PAEPS|nr:queuine tRNA-ribosyltransferase [Paenibacillus polymyxa]ADO54196.1 queuine tRNA-ribosyltransferase [Paenibacillus polymyxa SC2]WPQ57119.1 queuine tRNA-ribosyltransferase [Paenibacillus polymyxa]CCC83128.1 queuine tRNA-ribosyltransferase tRNA-guanine transglycosylase; Guanine insertion enzyme [Paenibacillus polymyxa M1]